MGSLISQYISIKRRYARSINLERDINDVEKLDGYIPTDRALNALRRIITGMQSREGNRAWTLTSVYGTGKSAFAHYIASLSAGKNNNLGKKALEITQKALGDESTVLTRHFPKKGYIRAIATSAREPISHTIIRALNAGADNYWKEGQAIKIPVVRTIRDLILETDKAISSQKVISLILDLASASKTGIFIIIDELGKSLEYSAYNHSNEDMYLLQQICELPKNSDYPIYFLGILHQGFAEYGQQMGTIQRNEWTKIQGRFEDIPFADSPSSMMALIGSAIDQSKALLFQEEITTRARNWFNSLGEIIKGEEISESLLESIYPLHPVTALALPILCQRYAQNDRSLFTFLTSNEPYGFQDYLQTTEINEMNLPCLKLDQVYDYFIEAVGTGLTSRPNLQRWVEIQELIRDARSLDDNSLKVLKVIGILNLVTTTGAYRATRQLVSLALCDRPDDDRLNYWRGIIDQLLNKGIITHFRQLDELRIWQGSDFNIDRELSEAIEKQQESLTQLLSKLRPLSPIIAQRHSYRTGTLRYLERVYLGDGYSLEGLCLDNIDSDGLIAYWIEGEITSVIPSETIEGKPFIFVKVAQPDKLRTIVREYAALKKIQESAPQLQTDGVARKEIAYRVGLCEQILDDVLSQAFDFSLNPNTVWVQGEEVSIHSISEFNATLSQVCDRVYSKTPILWNELINRRKLTSQGAKARRELIMAMIDRSHQERLGLSGYGAEVTMYYSLLETTNIHRQDVNNSWGFYPPLEGSEMGDVWRAIEDFCLSAKEKPHTLDKLYELLSNPPYGVKQGMIPVLIAAVILYHRDDVGVYQEGTYIPILGAEHFELLVREPARFAVKYFQVAGLRSEVFKELESILKQSNLKNSESLRNAKLLTVVTPLYQFVKRLPLYTKQTKDLSEEALALIRALEETIEPDELIFTYIPIACKLEPIQYDDRADEAIALTLRQRLVSALKEIHGAYDKLLSRCQGLLYEAFGVRDSLRQDLAIRARSLTDRCVERGLKAFISAVSDGEKGDRDWLEAVVMVIGDKPPASWKDEDLMAFEVKLSDLARRFCNLEALQNEVPVMGEGVEARRITLTREDGGEVHRLVWMDRNRGEDVDRLVGDIMSIWGQADESLKQAVLAKLIEETFKG